MLTRNKYLRELGVKRNDWPFGRDKRDPRNIPDDDTGICEADTYNMDVPLAMIIYTYLKKFKDTARGSYPACLTEEKWEEILNNMINGFAIIIKGIDSHTKRKKANRALKLFSRYFFALWW